MPSLRSGPQAAASFLAGVAVVGIAFASPILAAPLPASRRAPQQGRTQYPLPQRNAVDYPPDRNDPNAAECDHLVDPPADPDAAGGGIEIDRINVTQAMPICQQAAERRPLRARYEYLYGRTLVAARRYEEAGRQYMLAESAGYALADFSLAFLYESGFGVPRDFDTAAALYRRAASAGYADALAAEGMLFVKSATPDYATAKNLFERAVQAGSIQGQVDLGQLYEYGRGVAADTAKALECYHTAAMAGNSEAMYRIGMITKYSDEVQKDPPLACKWFQRAYENGHPYGTLELGNCYHQGQGVDKSSQQAFALYYMAAQAGLPLAQEFVGAIFESGDGATQNDAQSASWYRQAALQNMPDAMVQFGADLRLGRGVPWNEAQAMQWFQRAAGLGNADAMTALGVGYMDGLGQDSGQGRQDYGQAASWFSKAAAQGDGLAQINLGVLYENGRGVTQDTARARQLYAQAAASSVPQISALGKQYLANFRDVPRQLPQRAAPPGSTPVSNDSSSDMWATLAAGGAIIGGLALLSSLMSSGSSGSGGAGSSRATNWNPNSDDDFRQAQRNACAAALDTNCRDVFGNKW